MTIYQILQRNHVGALKIMPRTAGARHHALGQADGCDFVRMCVRVDGRYWLEADSDLLCCHAGPRDLHRTHLQTAWSMTSGRM